MNERFLKVIHDIIDALGGGHAHLHDAVDAATGPAAPAPSGNDDASGAPKDVK